MFIYLWLIKNFEIFVLSGMGFPQIKKKHCLWFFQSSNNSLGTWVPEHFWDFLWKFSSSIGTLWTNRCKFSIFSSLIFSLMNYIKCFLSIAPYETMVLLKVGHKLLCEVSYIGSSYTRCSCIFGGISFLQSSICFVFLYAPNVTETPLRSKSRFRYFNHSFQ